MVHCCSSPLRRLSARRQAWPLSRAPLLGSASRRCVLVAAEQCRPGSFLSLDALSLPSPVAASADRSHRIHGDCSSTHRPGRSQSQPLLVSVASSPFSLVRPTTGCSRVHAAVGSAGWKPAHVRQCRWRRTAARAGGADGEGNRCRCASLRSVAPRALRRSAAGWLRCAVAHRSRRVLCVCALQRAIDCLPVTPPAARRSTPVGLGSQRTATKTSQTIDSVHR